MGFYVHIYISFPICEETGKPYYHWKGLEKNYDLSTVPEVPKQHRRFLYDGYNTIQIYQNYMRDDHYLDSAEAVAHDFPSWERIEKYYLTDESKKYWTKEDHDSFHEAMKWFASKGYFIVHWG